MSIRRFFAPALAAAIMALPAFSAPPELRPGYSFHAFDHLYAFSEQAETAAACGVTVIYATGLGGDGYLGIPPAADWEMHLKNSREYNARAKSGGVPVVLGYLCATSIVGLKTFDAHWTDAMRAEFRSAPGEWLQQDGEGKPLPSWYGGEYNPACMNHPDWRAYQKFMVRAQIETGHDGIFFDNPTVHEKGCYCPHCMAGFAAFLRAEGTEVPDPSVGALRALAQKEASAFKRYRCTIARDFIAEMRAFARTINPGAVITANNSLNQPGVLFSQCHIYGYNIAEMSKTEDFVVIEDMGGQPRLLPDGKTAECGPTYAQLHAISHGKPLVAVTVAETDYHTPASLVRLAMVEAAARQTGYLLWPTWPEERRAPMAAAVRPCADWLRAHAALINDSTPRADVLVFLPFRRWVETKDCAVSKIAAELTRANVQYEVAGEEAFPEKLAKARVLVVEHPGVLNETERAQADAFVKKGGRLVNAEEKHWLKTARKAVDAPSLTLDGPATTVRGVLRDRADTTALFLYNLHIERLSSFEDKVTPAENITVSVRVPFKNVTSVEISSADTQTLSGKSDFTATPQDAGTLVTFTLPRLEIGLIALVKGN